MINYIRIDKVLIATLPTLRSDADLACMDAIFAHPAVEAARYNTGGATPYSPRQIMEKIAPIAQKRNKKLYIDLEGRQVRIARWTPLSGGVVTLNCDFEITLPAMIHFRRMDWFDVVSALPKERKIFFKPRRTRQECFLGESQSIHIVANNFSVLGYLRKQDREYIKAASKYGVNGFMLSFVERSQDIDEFYGAYHTSWARKLPVPNLVLKIESVRGMEWLKSSRISQPWVHLMAARDDLFLSYVNRRQEIMSALRLIAEKDPEAIVASRLLSGLEKSDEITLADMTDVILMHQLGYRRFMLSDELTDRFVEAAEDWQKIILPLLKTEGAK